MVAITATELMELISRQYHGPLRLCPQLALGCVTLHSLTHDFRVTVLFYTSYLYLSETDRVIFMDLSQEITQCAFIVITEGMLLADKYTFA